MIVPTATYLFLSPTPLAPACIAAPGPRVGPPARVPRRTDLALQALLPRRPRTAPDRRSPSPRVHSRSPKRHPTPSLPPAFPSSNARLTIPCLTLPFQSARHYLFPICSYLLCLAPSGLNLDWRVAQADLRSSSIAGHGRLLLLGRSPLRFDLHQHR